MLVSGGVAIPFVKFFYTVTRNTCLHHALYITKYNKIKELETRTQYNSINSNIDTRKRTYMITTI